MRKLEQQEVISISGGYTVVYVAANVNDPMAAGNIASLVAQLMNGQMDPSMFVQAISNGGTQLIEYMHVAGNMAPPMPPFPPPPPCPPMC